MAHLTAHPTSRARLFNELHRGRKSPSRVEDNATVTSGSSLDFHNEAIHSTPQPNNNTTQQPMPLHHNQDQDQDQDQDLTETGSESNTEMSIEVGRAAPRGTRPDHDDSSVNFVFNMGNDSMYELTQSPPFNLQPHNSSRNSSRKSSRKSNGAMRREASTRLASEVVTSNKAVKRAVSGTIQTIADAIGKPAVLEEVTSRSQDAFETAAAVGSRNTRFVQSRQSSANKPATPLPDQTPQRVAANNHTLQSTTNTANTLVLPDLLNLTELVSGTRKDVTPVLNSAAKPHSRFSSVIHTPLRPHLATVDNVAVAEEEKAIYASLQLLKEKVASLEMINADAEKQIEEYMGEIIDLRVELEMHRRRPDSALGSDEESAHDRWQDERMKLQASVAQLQDRLDKSERKAGVSDIALKRVTKERDDLIPQIALAYYNNEKLSAEHDGLRDSHAELQGENNTLKEDNNALEGENKALNVENNTLKGENNALKGENNALKGQNNMSKGEMDALRAENEQLRVQLAEPRSLQTQNNQINKGFEGKQVLVAAAPVVRQPSASKTSHAVQHKTEDNAIEGAATLPPGKLINQDVGLVQVEDVDSRVARYVQAMREQAPTAESQIERPICEQHTHRADVRLGSKSKSQHRQDRSGANSRNTATRRAERASVHGVNSDAESTTQLVIPKTRNTSKNVQQTANVAPREQDTRDLTLLSAVDPDEVADLRKNLELEMRGQRAKRNASAPAQSQRDDTTCSIDAGEMVGNLRKNAEQEMGGKREKRSASAPVQTERDDTIRSGGQPPPSVLRKSSYKDITDGMDFSVGPFSLRGGATDEPSKAAKNVRVQSPPTSTGPQVPPQQEETNVGQTSMLSNTSRPRRRAASEQGMTSAFIIPDIAMGPFHPLPTTTGTDKACICHTAASCTACHPFDAAITIPTPVPVSARPAFKFDPDMDITSATIRPSQPPALALATVIKQVEDEVTHLKLQLQAQQRLYHQHDTSFSKRRRVIVRARMDTITAELERRSDQVYALYDVLEGQHQQQQQHATQKGEDVCATHENADALEETLMSIGLDPAELAELSGNVGRRPVSPASAFSDFDGVFDGIADLSGEESDHLPEDILSGNVSLTPGGSNAKRHSAAF